jgi:hypothetical protein
MPTNRFCHHIHQNGTLCQSPPMRERDYCYAHLQLIGRRMQMAKARARAAKWDLNFPVPEDLHSVQVALCQLMDAIAADRIDPRRSHQLICVLRLAAANLNSKTPWDLRRFEAGPPTAPRVLDDPAFETTYGLPSGLDLKLQPAQAFPPAAEAASEGGSQLPASGNRATENRGGTPSASPTIPITVADIALWRHLHEASIAARREVQQGASKALSRLSPPASGDTPPLQRRALELIAEGHVSQVTPFDIELMEIHKTQGPAAMLKRIRQHEADELRQQRRRNTRATHQRLAPEAEARNAASLAARLLADSAAPSPLSGIPHAQQPSPQAGEAVKKKQPQSGPGSSSTVEVA